MWGKKKKTSQFKNKTKKLPPRLKKNSISWCKNTPSWQLNVFFEKQKGDFPDGPVVKTPHFQRRGCRFRLALFREL